MSEYRLNDIDALNDISCTLDNILDVLHEIRDRLPAPAKTCDTVPGDWCEVHQGIHEDEAR